MQRTRCHYFRDPAYACNKRQPGSGCAAIDGYNRIHAVLGGSDHCIATHPSDMAVAMVALDAVVHIQGRDGERTVPVGEFHLLPGTTPHRYNAFKIELAKRAIVRAINNAVQSTGGQQS